MNNKISSNNDKNLIELIDRLAPLNNKFRVKSDPLSKIELMWEFGEILNNYLNKVNVKLHTLLYEIYDPHSNVKMSYITRDLGSYCYRIYSFFEKKEDVRKKLSNLKSYSVFRESIPLLFNPKYSSKVKKDVVFGLINSNISPRLIVNDLKRLKQKIRPIRNPRNQKANQYTNEKIFLQNTYNSLYEFYLKNNKLPDKKVINLTFGEKEHRVYFVNILMSLASDSFISKINNLQNAEISENLKPILNISKGANDNRARFRKWVMSSTNLLIMAEGIYALEDENNYQFFRSKFIKK